MSVGTTSPESARRSTAKYAKNNRDKLKAKWRVQAAVRSGKLKKPAACPRCGRHVPLDFHHTHGYSDSKKDINKDKTSLKGKWLCRRCHSDPAGGKTSSGKDERSGENMRKARKKAEQTKKG